MYYWNDVVVQAADKINIPPVYEIPVKVIKDPIGPVINPLINVANPNFERVITDNKQFKFGDAGSHLRDGQSAESALRAEECIPWLCFVESKTPADGESHHMSALRRTGQSSLACEEGWSFIAEWIGVPLHHVLEQVGLRVPHVHPE